MKKVLVVDDDQAILTLLKYNLTKEGYEVETAIDGQEALDTALSVSFDFILLDIMLPKLDGIEVTKKLRQEKVATPIIMLTARDEETDKIIGLELGADDYITKPFSPREVIARLKAIGRRVTPANEHAQSDDLQKNEELYTFQDFSIDLTNYTVTVGDQKISLTPKEFELLAYFVKRPDRVLSRENLLNGVWGYDYVGQTRMVDMHVSHLREKIEKDPSHPTNIQTVRGFGYKFEGKLDES
ncbi:MAG TPA: response regulator transcription factor [Candidatus Ligilactobacillus excrementavium]|nr:response regulator transcription factor [Candidatus Ligilactobacillus excrementavium]